MNIKLLLLLLLLCFTSRIAAQDNHMDIMTTMTGEHDFAKMGFVMTTLDWNGDGNDDLVINEQQWNPDGYPFTHNTSGKLCIYFGGPNFDNIPEIEIPGHHQIEFSHTSSMCNAGDMNGDGIDDLALFRATMYEGTNDQHYDLQLCVFYGGANPDTIPDYVLTFPREEWDNRCGLVSSLGDINHDGKNEIGFILRQVSYPFPYSFNILDGSNMLYYEILEAGSPSDAANIVGVGDINSDGFDDFCTGYMYEVSNIYYRRIVLHYGNSSGVYSDSLVIYDGIGNNPFTFPVGDLNWDGYADFVSVFSGSTARLYFGSPNFEVSNYITFNPPYNGNDTGLGFAHGDVNADGISDFMGTNANQGNGYGDAYLWIGGAYMNGSPALHISPPGVATDAQMFGWCLTMGDYNGDGCCDAAISAPFEYSGTGIPGRVFVYAGNTQLTPNSDYVQTPAIAKLQLYPNPLQPQYSDLHVKWFTPLPPSSRGVIRENSSKGVESSTFEIYNIKGQKVKSFILNAEQTKSGSANYNLNGLSSGVYVCMLTNGKMQHKGKITILRQR